MEKELDKQILINATAAEVWKSITDVLLMASWMGDPSMNLEINTRKLIPVGSRICYQHNG